jgi:CHRD domain-containing protein
MKKRILLACSLLLTIVVVSFGHGFRDFIREKLTGYEEIPTLSTPATGDFKAKINRDGTAIDYELSYDIGQPDPTVNSVTQAHIHLGAKAFNGGISVFLCTNLTPPAGVPVPPPCPVTSGKVSGTLTAANVLGPAGQGIAAGEFEELIKAIRAGATYANLHTTRFPGGEIRAQLDPNKNNGHDRDHDDDCDHNH